MKHAVFKTLAGWMGVMASDKGLVRVILPVPKKEGVLHGLGVRDDGDDEYFADLIRRFRDYFQGRPAEFPDVVDISQGTLFQRRVWEACRTIPRGRTESYGWVAAEAGCPGGARAAGGALGRNPLPVIVPCHRVVAADGSLGGFTGGLDVKKMLLALEK